MEGVRYGNWILNQPSASKAQSPVEISLKQMIVILLDPTPNDGLGIPYPDNLARENNGYFFLKRSPEKIGNVKEIVDYPPLHRFISEIIQPISIFSPLRCGKVSSFVRGPEFNLPVAEWYVTIAFDSLYHNTIGAHRLLATRFIEFAASKPLNEKCMLALKPIHTSFNEFDGWTGTSLDFQFRCYGDTDEDARYEMFGCVEVVGHFLTTESSLWINKIDKNLKTIA